MCAVVRFDTIRAELASLISDRNVGLVIGSGASISSGAPSTADLIERIRTRFPLASTTNPSDLLSVGTTVSDHPAYGRLDLIQFVKDQFAQLEPSSCYRQLPRVVWRSIFTTNYDDLIEKAYQTPSRSSSIRAFTVENASRVVSRQDYILMFYLMGSVRSRSEDPDAPVVSHADYIYSIQKRASLLQLFRNTIIDGGKFVYIGYSFDDMILFGVLDEVSRLMGQRNVPYGYAILKDPPNDSSTIHRLTSRKIIPVRGSFEDFCELVKDTADGNLTDIDKEARKRSGLFTGITLLVGNSTVKLSAANSSVIREGFDIVDSDAIIQARRVPEDEELPKAVKRFLTGEHAGWIPYVRNWVFVRPWLRKLKAEIKTTVMSIQPGQGELFLVHGPAGVGKSVSIRQLAIDAYMEANCPVLIANQSWRSRPDVKMVARFIADIEAAMEDGDRVPPLVLIIDQAELMERSVPFRILRFLSSRGIATVIVLAARTNEYFRVLENSASASEQSQVTKISVSDKLDRSEMTDLIRHLNTIGVWERPMVTTESFWIDQIEKQWGSAFFDTLYELVEPVQRTLEERVWSEYERLNDVAQRAYKLIASTHQFGLPLKMEVLMRALDVPFETFESEVIRSEAQNVLFTEHQSSALNLFFRGRTQKISEVIFRKAVNDHIDQLEVFKEIARHTSPSEVFGGDELDALRTLLVHVFGPKGFDVRFSPDELAQIFEVAVEGIDDDVLEHHFGLVQREAGRLLSARKHLERSLALSSVLPDDLSVQRETIQNIQNSLAVVMGDLAMEALTQNNRKEAESLFEEARLCFIAARQGQFPNAYAYHAHANMLKIRSQRLFPTGSEERVLGLGEALEVTEEGIDNANADDRPLLVEMQSSLLEELGMEEDAIQMILDRAESGTAREKARYHLILARLLLTSDQQVRRKRLQRGHRHAVIATELDPDLFDAWRLRAEAYSKLQPRDFAGLMEFLQRALRADEGRDNLWVLYNLGVAAFYEGRHQFASNIFRRLMRVSRGHESRMGVEEYAGERANRGRYKYRGRIIRHQSRLMINSPDLTDYRYIWFNPRIQQYYTPRLGDEVEFSIGFNYRGLLADNLRRV